MKLRTSCAGRGPAGLLAILLAVMTGVSARADGLVALVHPSAEASPHPPLLLLLHGSGADERDMIGLWRDLPAAFMVVSPRGPFANSGGGYRWYRKGGATAEAADRDASRHALNTLLDDTERRFDADPTRVFVAGFSQGAVMVYDMALAEPGRFRGAAVLSGSLKRPVPLRADPRLHDLLFIAHGTADSRIPFASATAARAALGAVGAVAAFHAYTGMGHTVGATETRDLAEWLAGKLGSAVAGPPH